MKPSKRQIRIVSPAWARSLAQHIADQPRGYQTQMARDTGCSDAMINRIKTSHVKSSEWVEVLARYTGLPIPPLEVDEAQLDILRLSEKLSKQDREIVRTLMRDLASRKK